MPYAKNSKENGKESEAEGLNYHTRIDTGKAKETNQKLQLKTHSPRKKRKNSNQI